MLRVTSLLTLISLVCAVPEGKGHCEKYGTGTYCRDDVSGYRTCTGGYWTDNLKLAEDVDCKPGTRCACFIGNDCYNIENGGDWDDIGLEGEEICQPLKKAYPLEEILSLNYRKTGGYDVDPDEPWERFNISGQIKQEVVIIGSERVQRLMNKWVDNDNNNRYFELIIPEDGAFTKYSGQYPNTCTNKTLKTFPMFAEQIQYFRLEKADKLSKNQEKQVWVNYVYHYPGETGDETKWTVIADHKRKSITPVKYYDAYFGTQEEQCCGHATTIVYDQVAVDEYESLEDWFKIPDFCP